MQRIGFWSLVVCLTVLASNTAQAHFVWIIPATANNPPRLCFGEEPAPGEAHLVDKVAKTKVFVVLPKGERQPLKLEKQIQEDEGWWNITRAQPGALEAVCDYGTLERQGSKFHLYYYAKCLPQSAIADSKASTEAAFEIVPVRTEKGLKLGAIFQGQAAAKAEFTLIDAEGKTQTLLANEAGEVNWDTALGKGQLAARAKHVQPLNAGKGSTEPTEARHYATIVLASDQTIEKNPATAAAPAGSAVDLLTKARAKRAVWQNFNGFTADFTVRVDDKSATGKIVVDENGDGELVLEDKALRTWLLEQLSSLVQHRLPSFETGKDARFGEEPAGHPLGTKIILGDPKFESVYRIKDDVVTEVNRKAGKSHFTISVLEVERNREGKYLPRVVTLTTWDSATEEVKSAVTLLNTWRRVENIDLPERILQIDTRKGQRGVHELIFSNQKVTPAKPQEAAPEKKP